ncbi:hypothetical protein ACOSQ4_023659 [Xanthoceras sorbifolium]
MGDIPKSDDSKGRNGQNRSPLHCDYCDTNHHTRDTCYKLHGYPEGHRLHKSNKEGRNRSKEGTHAANNVQTQSIVPKTSPYLSTEQFQQLCAMMAAKFTPETQANAAAVLETSPTPIAQTELATETIPHVPTNQDTSHDTSVPDPTTASPLPLNID